MTLSAARCWPDARSSSATAIISDHRRDLSDVFSIHLFSPPLKMLPDYPNTKKLLGKACRERIEAAQRESLGPFANIPPSTLHEGDRCRLVRDDGTVDDSKLKDIEGTVAIEDSPDNPGGHNPAEFYAALDS